MESDLAQDTNLAQARREAHALLDMLPPKKLGAVRSLLEAIIDDDELTAEDRGAIQAGLTSLEANGGVPMEVVLADFGLTMEDFEKMAESDNERS